MTVEQLAEEMVSANERLLKVNQQLRDVLSAGDEAEREEHGRAPAPVEERVEWSSTYLEDQVAEAVARIARLVGAEEEHELPTWAVHSWVLARTGWPELCTRFTNQLILGRGGQDPDALRALEIELQALDADKARRPLSDSAEAVKDLVAEQDAEGSLYRNLILDLAWTSALRSDKDAQDCMSLARILLTTEWLRYRLPPGSDASTPNKARLDARAEFWSDALVEFDGWIYEGTRLRMSRAGLLGRFRSKRRGAGPT